MFKKLCLSLIFSIHFAFTIWLLSPFHFKKPVPEKTKIAVHTITLQPKIQAIPRQEKKEAAVVTQPTPVKPIQKKKDTPKPAVKKTPPIQDKKVAGKPKAPPKVPPKQEKRGKVSDALLKDLDDQIKALDKKSSFKKAAPYVPAVTEQDYSSDLASLLHQSLNLPDHGEVKIKLTVRKDGTVVSVAILQAESEKNRQYLQENLPKLRFPSFQGSFAKNAQHTFVLTFCNEL